MKVTTSTTGRETTVTLEASNGVFGDGVIIADRITLVGQTLERAEFAGLTIAQIKAKFQLHQEGSELINRDQTTLDSDGIIDFGFDASGPAQLVQLKSTS